MIEILEVWPVFNLWSMILCPHTLCQTIVSCPSNSYIMLYMLCCGTVHHKVELKGNTQPYWVYSIFIEYSTHWWLDRQNKRTRWQIVLDLQLQHVLYSGLGWYCLLLLMEVTGGVLGNLVSSINLYVVPKRVGDLYTIKWIPSINVSPFVSKNIIL